MVALGEAAGGRQQSKPALVECHCSKIVLTPAVNMPPAVRQGFCPVSRRPCICSAAHLVRHDGVLAAHGHVDDTGNGAVGVGDHCLCTEEGRRQEGNQGQGRAWAACLPIRMGMDLSTCKPAWTLFPSPKVAGGSSLQDPKEP